MNTTDKFTFLWLDKHNRHLISSTMSKDANNILDEGIVRLAIIMKTHRFIEMKITAVVYFSRK